MKFNAHKTRFTFAILSERPCRPVLPCGGDSDELGYKNINRDEGRNKNEDEDELAWCE